MDARDLLSHLPSVDEALKSEYGKAWLGKYPRRYVLDAIREAIALKRKEILEGTTTEVSIESMAPGISFNVQRLTAPSLRPLINATGIVVHTNLGRSILSERIMEHVSAIATGYSNLEYDLNSGSRGKRHTHIKRLLREITGAEDGFAVNNNAAAVFLCLSALARGREVIVSRGELVEIGGSFRIPDVMSHSGAILKEVGATNKTHLHDYENAYSETTALVLKVHRANFRIIGFTEEVPVETLVSFGHGRGVPVMYDLGSGCLISLDQYGIHGEPAVQDMVKSGADLITFSGDKLLGGPQAGIIVGKREFIGRIQKHPLARALRIDKLTLAALEATLMEYLDAEQARKHIPTLRMLLEDPGSIKARAKRIVSLIRRVTKNAVLQVMEDSSQAGGGSLPEVEFPTYVIAVKPEKISVNELEERLRKGEPAIIARIQGNSLILDARTIGQREITAVAHAVTAALR